MNLKLSRAKFESLVHDLIERSVGFVESSRRCRQDGCEVDDSFGGWFNRTYGH